MKKLLNMKQVPSDSDTYFKILFEESYKYFEFTGGSYMLWSQQITKKSIRGGNAASDNKIRAVIYIFIASVYLHHTYPIICGTIRKGFDLGD